MKTRFQILDAARRYLIAVWTVGAALLLTFIASPLIEPGISPLISAELRRSTELQKCVFLPQDPVFLHIPPSLAHEPDWRRINRLTSACAEKAALAHGRRDHACYIIEFVFDSEVK